MFPTYLNSSQRLTGPLQTTPSLMIRPSNNFVFDAALATCNMLQTRRAVTMLASGPVPMIVFKRQFTLTRLL